MIYYEEVSGLNTTIRSMLLSPASFESTEAVEQAVMPFATPMEYSGKQLISNLQEDFSSVYYIKSGGTYHVMTGENTEKLLYQLQPGWFFGNIFPGDPRDEAISVYALDRSEIWRIPRKEYLQLLASDPGLASYILKLLGVMHDYLTAEIGNLSFNSCKTRLMRIYCSQVEGASLSEDGKWFCLDGKLTHNELAAAVGSARVTISKLINELCDDGFLRIINRRSQVSVDGYNDFMAQSANT